MSAELVAVSTSDGEMPGHLWLPEGGTGPGILLLQEIFGVSSYIRRRAQDLADLGYVVLAPEIYWRLGVSRVEEGPDALETAYGLVQRLDGRAAAGDARAALDHLRGRPEVYGGAGIVGFCFGGGLGFGVAATSSPDALVSYYGSALPAMLALADSGPEVDVVRPDAVTAPSLHHFGLADQFVPRPVVERLREALEPLDNVTWYGYEGADHAFDNSNFFLYDQSASDLAWARTRDWLGEHLPVG